MNKLFLKTIDNIKISINHYDSGKDEVVILCPGWFMTKDSASFNELARVLGEKYDVISMDFRGHGNSGGFYTFTAKEEADIDIVVDFAAKKYKKVYLFGFSLGGALVLLYGAKHKNVDKIIAVSAPVDFMKIENRMYSPDAWIPTLFQKFEPSRWLTIRAGFPWYKKDNPIDFVDKITVPTLFIAGEKDPTVLPWHTKMLSEKAVCKKDYVLFKNARHAEDLFHDYPEKFLKICFDWLEE